MNLLIMTYAEFESNLPPRPKINPDEAFIIELPAPPSYNQCLDWSYGRVQRSVEYSEWLRETRDPLEGEVKEQLSPGLYGKMKSRMLFVVMIACLHGNRDTDNALKPTLDGLEIERSEDSGEILNHGVYENDRQVDIIYLYRKQIPHNEPERVLVLVQPLDNPGFKGKGLFEQLSLF